MKNAKTLTEGPLAKQILLVSLPLKPRETPLLPAAQTLGCLA